jgi:hypothetical protein
MIKYVIILVFVFGGNSSLQAQNYFNKLYSENYALGNLVVENDRYYATGNLFTPTNSIAVFELDTFGILVKFDTIYRDPVLSSNAQLLMSDGKLKLGLQIIDAPPFEPDKYDIVFHELDNNLAKKDTMRYSGAGADYVTDMIQSKDKGYLITGGTNSIGEGFLDAFILKIDSLKNIEWIKSFGGSLDDASYSINQFANGNIFISGQSRSFSSDWNIYMVIVDDQGNLIWEKNYGGINEDNFGLSKILSDQTILLCRNEKKSGVTVLHVEKLDKNGEIIWTNSFPHGSFSSVRFGKPLVLKDGSIVLNIIIRNTIGSVICKVLRVDPLGKIIWSRDYEKNTNHSQYINDIKATEDGLLLSGTAFDSNDVQRGWLIKTDCNGCEDETCATGQPCFEYDCTQYPLDATFAPSKTFIDLAKESGVVTFNNISPNTISRIWNFGDAVEDYTKSTISHTYAVPGMYEVTLIAYHGVCSDTSIQTIQVVNTAGIGEYSNIDYGLKVFPNPSKGDVTISLNYPSNGTCELIDVLGKVQHQIELHENVTSYELTEIPHGVYTLLVRYSNGKREIRRIIIQ